MEGEERPLAQESLKQHWIRRPCLWVAFAIKWLPVFFITGVIAWSYYALVVALCIQTITSLGEQVVILIFYHVILVLFVSSYWKTIFSPICETPQKWFLSTAMVEKLNKAKSEQDWKNLLEMFVIEMELPVVQRSIQGAIRYCDKCKAIKPDRSHHCSVCGVCVLKMDHHCPWVNNCVAFYNYKFFMLFLGYALIYCLFLVASVFKYFIWFWTGELEKLYKEGSGDPTARFHILFLFFVAIMFCISVSSLFWYHVYLVLNNRTTLEQFRAPSFTNGASDENGWSLGKFNNFQEVFGDNKWTWFLPVQTAIGDGLTFPTRLNATNFDAANSYQSIDMRTMQNNVDTEVYSSDDNNAISPYQQYLQNGGTRSHSPKATEVVLDNHDKVSIKVRETEN